MLKTGITASGVHPKILTDSRYDYKLEHKVQEACIIYNGEVCSEAEMTYFCFTEEKAASDFYFRGCEVED